MKHENCPLKDENGICRIAQAGGHQVGCAMVEEAVCSVSRYAYQLGMDDMTNIAMEMLEAIRGAK